MNLSAFLTVPGVLQACIADDAGRLLDCLGHIAPPDASILVLAHATLSAAAELGRRSGNGDCKEIIQQHETGVVYLHSLPQRRILLIRCQTVEALPAIRSLCLSPASPASPSPRNAPPPVTHDLASALHAEPAW